MNIGIIFETFIEKHKKEAKKPKVIGKYNKWRCQCILKYFLLDWNYYKPRRDWGMGGFNWCSVGSDICNITLKKLFW